MVDDQRVPVHLENGHVISVHKDSFPAGIFDRSGAIRKEVSEFGTPRMDWSLGIFGDMLWIAFPESRQAIYELIRWNTENALDNHRELWAFTIGSLVEDGFFEPVLQPALERYPESRELLGRCCALLMHVVILKPQHVALYETICFTIFDRLAAPRYLRIVEEINPDLAEVIRLEDRY